MTDKEIEKKKKTAERVKRWKKNNPDRWRLLYRAWSIKNRAKQNAYQRARYQKNLEKERAKAREKNKLSSQRWPEKHRARKLLRNAVAKGEIIKKPCRKCGNKKVQGHHTDYSKPLKVIWLCQLHHGEQHRAKNASIQELIDLLPKQ